MGLFEDKLAQFSPLFSVSITIGNRIQWQATAAYPVSFHVTFPPGIVYIIKATTTLTPAAPLLVLKFMNYSTICRVLSGWPNFVWILIFRGQKSAWSYRIAACALHRLSIGSIHDQSVDCWLLLYWYWPRGHLLTSAALVVLRLMTLEKNDYFCDEFGWTRLAINFNEDIAAATQPL